MNAGLVSRTFGRIHAFGPWFYFDNGRLVVHFYARWFWLPYQCGFHWGFSVMTGDRMRVFKCGQRWAGR